MEANIKTVDRILKATITVLLNSLREYYKKHDVDLGDLIKDDRFFELYLYMDHYFDGEPLDPKEAMFLGDTIKTIGADSLRLILENVFCLNRFHAGIKPYPTPESMKDVALPDEPYVSEVVLPQDC